MPTPNTHPFMTCEGCGGRTIIVQTVRKREDYVYRRHQCTVCKVEVASVNLERLACPPKSVMNCKKCGGQTRIITSQRRLNGVWRRHECFDCKHRQTSTITTEPMATSATRNVLLGDSKPYAEKLDTTPNITSGWYSNAKGKP